VPNFGIGSWPARRARINASTVALRQGSRERTYGALAERVDRLANALAGRGVRHGDRIAYLGANDILTFETWFAAARLGAIFAPFNTRLAAPEIAFMIDDAAPKVFVYGPEMAALVAEVDPAAHGVGTVVPIGSDGPDGYEALLASGSPEPVDADVELSDDVVILYTSGTTGRPKGAVLTHANLTFNMLNQFSHADILSSDVAMCTAPLFHATGIGQVQLPVLFKGGTVVVAEKFDPPRVLATIAEQRIVTFSAVPTMLQMLCDHPDFATTDLRSLRYIMYGGSPVAERVAVAWQQRGVDLLQGYGMTEASPGVYMAPRVGARERPLSVGAPHFYVDVKLASTGSDTAESGSASVRQGELLVRGLNVFRGYWNRPEATAQALAGGWFHSGDVLRVDDDGWAYVVDRIKDMIISGGENIYPAEVEAAIGKLPGVASSAVIAHPDERWGEVGQAFVILTGEHEWTEDSLRAALRGSLAAYKIPKYVQFVDDLPRTATGKVRKQELRTRVEAVRDGEDVASGG
jgi:fatty-acyl-CoA synthase